MWPNTCLSSSSGHSPPVLGDPTIHVPDEQSSENTPALGPCSWTCLSQGVQGLKARGWWMSQQMQGCLQPPAPSPGCIPALSLWETTCSWGTVWVKLCLYQGGRLALHIWPKYQSQAHKREGGSSLGHLCHDKDDLWSAQ